jgi:hypothetical protein
MQTRVSLPVSPRGCSPLVRARSLDPATAQWTAPGAAELVRMQTKMLRSWELAAYATGQWTGDCENGQPYLIAR